MAIGFAVGTGLGMGFFEFFELFELFEFFKRYLRIIGICYRRETV